MVRQILLIILMILILPLHGEAANSATNFGGVGIDGIPLADGRIAVRQLVAGGPAHLAGIRVGDIITHIDSKPTRGSNFKDIVDRRLRGHAGTKVLITIVRAGEQKPLHFTLVRKQLIIVPGK
ncbi:MAG: PDZ domain-containing protein [Geobacter sp.]|nr:MAG: PDZ domain-containing protein [Geobacter sp.]